MPVRTFDEDARLATQTSLPVPRGIALQYAPPDGSSPSTGGVQDMVADIATSWTVRDFEGLEGWYELTPPATASVTLGELWEKIRSLRALPGVQADPLFLVAMPEPVGTVEAEAFALGFGREQFGLWGDPYDAETARKKRLGQRDSDWHLGRMEVRKAWKLWKKKHPEADKRPGHEVVVGHPDTGYSGHFELGDRFITPGKSFLLDKDGQPEPSAEDDLIQREATLLQNPGHGTSTASVIVSGDQDKTGGNDPEAYGVAPGARVLPLRVSRSVVHFDFSNVGRAILHAADKVDVISMSLGGPAYSSFVRECIRHAQEQGVIVVSAAGNNVPTTVFPAAFPEVIAVAATHAADGPWRFTGLGPLVDIAAPGEEVWCARAARAGQTIVPGLEPDYRVTQGTGTSFATACVAGLAALWLSYHGGRTEVAKAYGGKKSLVPFAFQYLLATTANKSYDFVGRGRYGAGIPNARALLEAQLPNLAQVERFERVIRAQRSGFLTTVTGLFSGVLGLADRSAAALTMEATVDDQGQVLTSALEETNAVMRAEKEQSDANALLTRLLGDRTDELADELLARIATDRLLLVGFQRWRNGESLLPFLDRILRGSAGGERTTAQLEAALSRSLKQVLEERRTHEEHRLRLLHRGKLTPGVSFELPQGADRSGMPSPPARRLRAYAFDPSLATKLETAPIHQVTISTRWETVQPGPIGEYLEVIDVDPSSGCMYSPVDLNHPYLLAQDGLEPCEDDPQSHQQMVYAVAMNTINRFELALGRPIFWSSLRPWLQERPDEQSHFTSTLQTQIAVHAARGEPVPDWLLKRDRYVQRLRIYPHALRAANAFYSPRKRALLFGYFPASDDDTGRHLPGGMVFSCLSHDIIAHEITHALLDGMHPYFNEPSNVDVWAFHEAFADIMALFQHFTYPEVLRHQIANTRGDLETNNFLAQLAQQFGEETGKRGALRDALGSTDKDGTWTRRTPDPRALRAVTEPHQRGSILIAAVFDAFLALYNDRVADLLRIYTNGTGILPAGHIHPDLVNRLANEAASAAEEVLRVCIRALDYVPPVDITFGEFLRALITADHDLPPGASQTNRIAFIDAFRSWGIYPRDVSVLSDRSLRWRGPEDGVLTRLTEINAFRDHYQHTLEQLAPTLREWQPGHDRGAIFEGIVNAQAVLHELLRDLQANAPQDRHLFPWLDLRRGASFSVGNLRPTSRIGSRGERRTEMVVEIVQTYRPPKGEPDAGATYRGGATLIVDLQSWEIRYVIQKRLWQELPDKPGGRGKLASRFSRARGANAAAATLGAWAGEDTGSLASWLSATYACQDRRANRRKKMARDEPFALLHQDDL